MKSDFNIITVTGFGATGSSSISHLVSEFDDVKSLGTIEFWLLQDLHGISDLDYFLNDGNHRSKTFVSIRNFERLIKRNKAFYSKYFPNFDKISSEYIASLKDTTFNKALHPFEYEQSFIMELFVKVFFKLQAIKHKLFSPSEELILKLPSNQKHHFKYNPEYFYQITKKFTRKLFESIMDNNDYNHIMVDQLVPATNISRYFNYIDRLKVIVVDRDPRDIFLLNKLKWKGTPVLCDTDDVNVFIDWYSSIRYNSFKGDNSNVMRINFEDLIYNYEMTLEKIIDFCMLNKNLHKQKFKIFNPKKSMSNTKLWKLPHKFQNEISEIENKLKQYCYSD